MSGKSKCAESEEQIAYYRDIAKTSGQNRLRHVEQLNRLIAERKRVEKDLENQSVYLSQSKKKYETLVETSLQGFLIVNENEKPLFANTSMANMLGFDSSEDLVRLETLESLYPPEESERLIEYTKARLRNEAAPKTYEVKWYKKDRSIVWLLANVQVIEWDGKQVAQSIYLDITERKKSEENFRTQSQITTNMVEGAMLSQASNSTIIYTNPAFLEMFGYTPAEMLGKHISMLNAPEDLSAEENLRLLASELSNNGKWRGEVRNIKKDGTVFWCSVNLSTFNHSEYGEVWVSVYSDTTDRRLIEERLKYQACFDPLTGLINRREFEHRAERLISTTERTPRGHALCFLDLDQFKVVNDTCGHSAGDELLKQIGQILQNNVRRSDTLARLGGDEFGVLMEQCSLGQAQRTAEVLLKQVEDFQFSWEGQSFRIGVSIGLVPINDTTGNLVDLLKQADASCYVAKDLGRNRVHIYHPEDIELAQRYGEMQWATRINRALEDNLFTLYAQSIESLDENSERHYELLVRMIDEEGNTIPPGAFLPAAERYNLINKLDAWVVNRAITLIAANPRFFASIHFFSINLSGHSLTNDEFLESVIAEIKERKIDARKICFEITETAAISNLTAAGSFISSLRKLGCSFALDDFGSGVSSFGYLKNLSVDYLKIDGMFVKDMVDDPIDYAMVKSINDIGHVIGMKTIAEFVENDSIKEQLKEIGVDFAQGYGIEKPKPLLDLIEQSKNTEKI